jgi:protease-4
MRVISALDAVLADPLVRGMVLEINSPGGTAEAIEEIYYRVVVMAERIPVVVSIGAIGASGGYYIATPADYIFVKPSSETGGIGLIAELPEVIEVPELIATGPFKIEITLERILEVLDRLKKNFLNVVYTHRKEKLTVDPIELSGGETYIGLEAVQIGLVDELGGLGDAIHIASTLAGLWSYRVVYVDPLSYQTDRFLYIDPSEIESNSTTIPRYYYLYVKVGETE